MTQQISLAGVLCSCFYLGAKHADASEQSVSRCNGHDMTSQKHDETVLSVDIMHCFSPSSKHFSDHEVIFHIKELHFLCFGGVVFVNSIFKNLNNDNCGSLPEGH